MIKPWGMALERLRVERDITMTELCYRVRMGLPEYRVICYKLKKGPSVETLGRLIEALDSTWAEWGQIYDAVTSGLSSEHRSVESHVGGASRQVRMMGEPRGKPPASRGTASSLVRRGQKANP